MLFYLHAIQAYIHVLCDPLKWNELNQIKFQLTNYDKAIPICITYIWETTLFQCNFDFSFLLKCCENCLMFWFWADLNWGLYCCGGRTQWISFTCWNDSQRISVVSEGIECDLRDLRGEVSLLWNENVCKLERLILMNIWLHHISLSQPYSGIKYLNNSIQTSTQKKNTKERTLDSSWFFFSHKIFNSFHDIHERYVLLCQKKMIILFLKNRKQYF